MTTPFQCFEEGRLSDAVQAAIQAVKRDPGNVEHRWELIIFLSFSGDLQRAESHLKVMMQQSADLAAEVMMLNSILKGEIARRQCFEEGRLPRFTDRPSHELQTVLKALTEMNDDVSHSAKLLRAVNDDCSTVSGSCDAVPFRSFRDGDDLTAMFFEAITMGGEYYWIPFSQIRKIELTELQTPQDILWRQVELTTIDAQDVTAYLPSLYYGSHLAKEELLKLGRAAEFSSGELTRGVGGKTYLIDGVPKPLSLMNEISFDH